MSDNSEPAFWDNYFNVPTVQGDGVAVDRRSVLNIVGGDVSDDEANLRTQVRLSRAVGDDDGVSHIDAAVIAHDFDDYVVPLRKVGHVSTDDDTPEEIVLLTMAEDERRRLEVVVTATNEDGSSGAVFVIPAHTSCTAGTGTLESGGTDPAPDAANTALLDAAITVDDDDVVLTVTGLAAERFTWGWEVRSQQQLFEEAPP